jgi:hypothetical protein
MSHELVHAPPKTAPEPAVGSRTDTPATIEIRRPSGPAAAVILAAGLASFTLGVLSVLTAASSSVSSALTLSERVGDLSGLTTAVAVVFFGAWGVLAIVWRRSDPPLLRVAATTAVLAGLGLLGTFPPFFNAL